MNPIFQIILAFMAGLLLPVFGSLLVYAVAIVWAYASKEKHDRNVPL